MTRTLEILAVGGLLGLLFGVPVGWWAAHERNLARRVTGRTVDFTRNRVGL